MQQNSIDSGSHNLEFSIPKGTTIEVVLRFLDERLPDFGRDFSGQVDAEDDISQECCIFLGRHAREHLFMFHFQHKFRGSRRSVDLSVISAEHYASKEPIIVIEAKRLPTPGGAKRMREYVVGNYGGIERFKRNLHADGLTNCVMLAYVQANTFDHWISEVNSWIKDLAVTNEDSSIIWDINEQLRFTGTLDTVNKYSSSHLRTNDASIALTHYWILLNSKKV